VKRKAFSATAVVGLFVAATVVSNAPVQGHDDDLFFRRQSEIQKGFAIAPVWLNLEGKDPALVGLGSYIVNAQAGCNDCHTCPSYDPSAYEGHPRGHNPFPPPFGDLGDGKINSQKYLAGGVDFGPPPNMGGVTSDNLTPDSTGKPDGLTLEQFKIVIRTGHDVLTAGHPTLAVMPWPYYRNMTDLDLDAIYTFLRAIPSATTPATHCANAGE
jgi:hypothetical protein